MATSDLEDPYMDFTCTCNAKMGHRRVLVGCVQDGFFTKSVHICALGGAMAGGFGQFSAAAASVAVSQLLC